MTSTMTGSHIAASGHRVAPTELRSVCDGRVRWSPLKSAWFAGMAISGFVGGAVMFSWPAVGLYVSATVLVLLFGHSLGSHRKLVHDSFECSKWLEYALVYCGVQVGLAGPIGLLRQHDLRDFAQRQTRCHDYLRHGRSPLVDAWWQLGCILELDEPPQLNLEPRVANDRVFLLLERTWPLQQLPLALLFFIWGGWSFVFWGVCARIATTVFGHWLIGYMAHNHGQSPLQLTGAAVQGRNVPWVSLLTMGECWHNNHHAYPGSARIGLERGEWDPGWWVLRGLEKLGLVWSLQLPKHLPARPELKAHSSRHELPA